MGRCFFYGILCCCVLACGKTEPNPILGNIKLVLTTKHHNDIVPNCIVYLKYDPTTNPGTDPNNYNQEYSCDAVGVAEIPNLFAGNYAILGIGYDGIDSVNGTAYITLQKPLNGDPVTYTLQVSE